MAATRKLTNIFGKFAAPFKKISGAVSPGIEDDSLVDAVVQRIEVEGEPPPKVARPGEPVDKEDLYERLLRRLDWHVKKSGIGPEELVRTYPGEVRAVLVQKSLERSKKRESGKVHQRLIEIGFKNLGAGVWVLPPKKAPRGNMTYEEMKIWWRQMMTKNIGKGVDYVFPFIASVDLKAVIAERKGIRKMPTARTLYTVLGVDEVVPPSHLYLAMKARGLSVRNILLAGDIVLLASAFAEGEEMESIMAREEEISRKLRHATGLSLVGLEDLANLGADSVGAVLDGVVPHPRDTAQRLIVEAQYWMRFLGGTVPDRV